MKKLLAFLLILSSVLCFTGCSMTPAKNSAYDEAVRSSPYFLHAMGGDNGHRYLNSIDVLQQKYEKGFRLFEADAAFTSDGRLVMIHRWSRKDIVQNLGQVYNEEDPIPTYDEFMSWQFHGKYQATSFVQVLDFMRQHTDMFLLLDCGLRNPEKAKVFYEAVVQEAGSDTSVLDRIIPYALNESVLEAILEVYNFRLRNFHIYAEVHRPEELKTIQQIIDYAKKTGCQSCTATITTATKEVCSALQEADIYLYVFTTNNLGKADLLRFSGATSVGTDFLG